MSDSQNILTNRGKKLSALCALLKYKQSHIHYRNQLRKKGKMKCIRIASDEDPNIISSAPSGSRAVPGRGREMKLTHLSDLR